MIYGNIEKIKLYQESIKNLMDNKFLIQPQKANTQMASIEPLEINK